MGCLRKLEGYQSYRKQRMLATLERSIKENNPQTVQQCIRRGLDLNATTPVSGLTPLELALRTRNAFMLKVLLDSGGDVEWKNSHGSTTLIEACRYGYLECVQLLVEHGANIYSRDVDGKTCLQVALEEQRYYVVTYLLIHDASKGVGRPADGLCLFQHLIMTDDAALILKLKRKGFNLNVQCPDGTGVVFSAVKYCKYEAMKALLQAGADPNIRSANGDSALHEAVRQNSTFATKQLIEHGAISHLEDKGTFSPFGAAIYLRYISMVRLLLDGGADVDQDLGRGGTPLTLACLLEFREGVQLLVERGANLKARTASGKTCLILALEGGNLSIADYLLGQDVCEVNGTGRDGFNVLHHAVLFNNTDLMRKLIYKQADVNARNHKGEVPIYLAVRHNTLNMLRMLLEAGAHPTIDTNDGDFALHEAVTQGSIESVKLLLDHGADRSRRDKNGMTPAEVATRLVPPPRDIIHCLLTNNLDNQNLTVSHSMKDHVEAKKKIFDSEVEQSLYCPITLKVMKDPVIAMDGRTYERKAIKKWINDKRKSPVTRQPLTSYILIPNLTVKHLIDKFTDVNRNP